MNEAGKSISAFIGRTLEAVSPNSWIPATVLVGGGILAYAVDASPNESFGEAIRWLAGLGLADLAVAFVFICVLSVLIQPFQFSMIRLLEGYWGSSEKVERVRRAAIGRQAKKVDRLAARESRRNQVLRGTDEDNEVLSRLAKLQSAAGSNGDDVDPEPDRDGGPSLAVELGEVPRSSNTKFAGAEVAAASARVRHFPSDPHMMPTGLGNRLRAAEETASQSLSEDDPTAVRRLVLERFHTMPAGLQRQHDMHRSQLDVFCTLVFVWLALVVWYALRLSHDHAMLGLTVLPMAGVFASYHAALLAAEGYGDVLKAMMRIDRDRAVRNVNSDGAKVG